MGPSATQVSGQLSQEQWLAVALDTLSHAGRSRLHLESLISAMPVSKGSFYHHFPNREALFKSVLEYWASRWTYAIRDQIAALEGRLEEAQQRRALALPSS